MKNKNTEQQLEQVLESIAAHGRNVRRQERLMEQIDRMAAAKKRRRLWPYWTAVAAAASVALVLLWQPSDQEFVAEEGSKRVELPDDKKSIVPEEPIYTASAAIQKSIPTFPEEIPEVSAEETAFEFSGHEEAPEPVCDEKAPEQPHETEVPKVVEIKTNSLVVYSNKKERSKQKAPIKDLLGNPLPESNYLLAINFKTAGRLIQSDLD